ncbi:MAG: N-formylglutamate amidohydrolase [Candidatus Eremiobacteraeota bacterium]|nr:N-formylglutamate amidohydrolase [Candidatus Eremiobacteraeota bacterium]
MSALPFLLSIPHGGTEIPAELTPHVVATPAQMAEDVDHFTREVFALREGKVAVVLESHTSRSFVDVNRDPSLYPPHDNDGAVKATSCTGHDLFGDWHPAEPMVERLLKRYWNPYHEALSEAVLAPGLKLALDCHSMAPVGPSLAPDAGRPRPLICLGDRHGQSAPQGWVDRLAECFCQVFGLPAEQVVANKPYSGGYITRRYGHNPLPFIQIEYSRALYMQPPHYRVEEHRLDEDWAAEMRRRFHSVLTLFHERVD